MKKRWLILMTAMTLTVALTGCSTSDKGTSSGTGSSDKKDSGTKTEEKDELTQNEDGLYEIGSAEDMVAFKELVEADIDKNFDEDHSQSYTELGCEITADIDMSSVCSEEKGSWVSIGYQAATLDSGSSINGDFRGIVKGNGHTISGLYIKDAEDVERSGLFCEMYQTTVSDLTFADCSVSGGRYVGVLAGHMTGCEVSNIVFEDTVTVEAKTAAGTVTGFAEESGTFDKITNYATVTSDSGAGGLFGTASTPVISNCNNYGTITSGNYVGGIVGSMSGSSYYDGEIVGCINYGDIIRNPESESFSEIKQYQGGIAGYNGGTIHGCVNAGLVDGCGYSAYDIVDRENGAVNYCGNVGEVKTDVTDPYGAVTIRTRYSYNVGTVENTEDGTIAATGYILDEEQVDGEYTYPMTAATAATINDASVISALNEKGDYWKLGDEFPVWSGTAFEK